MVNYTFALKVKGFHEESKYSLNLTKSQEDNPESVFNLEIRESMRHQLQNQSACKINDSHLNKMIKNWIQDIKQGYRDTITTLDLPLLLEENISKLNEQGNQEIPGLITPDLSNIEPDFGMLPPLIFS